MTDEAILPLEKVMRIVGTPRHTSRLSGSYVSRAASHGQLFLENLQRVTGRSLFWDAG